MRFRFSSLIATADEKRLDQLEDDMRFVKTKLGISNPGMPNLNNTTLTRLPVLYPDLTEQSAVDAKLAQEDSRRSAPGGLLQSLFHHLLTGQVRLPEFAKTSS